jgi:acyl-CoA synthetase (AMP-forming)/AMP-acid ligase II
MINQWTTLVDMVRWRALHQPDMVAHTFLMDDIREESSINYRELDRQARSIAAWLQSLKLAGERILLLYPPGLEFISAFWGCLYAGAIAIPLPTINVARPNRWLNKLRSIIDDAQPQVCLTTGRSLTRLENLLLQVPDLRSIKWLATEEFESNLAERWAPSALTGPTLAYLQYTSGSTSNPKGVMITHDNVLHNLEDFRSALQHTPETSIVSWLPHCHDLGLVYGILMPTYAGISGYLMSPPSFIQQPLRWLLALSHYKATHSAAPNFAYEYCIAKFKPEKCIDLDLSNWRVTINGAEPIRISTIKRFSETFAPYNFRRLTFRPAYGLAEATLVVSVVQEPKSLEVCRGRANELGKHAIVEVAEEESNESGGGISSFVGCGYNASSMTIAVVHPDSLTRCLPGEVGEIWVAGPSIAQGYWNKPHETENIFQAHIAETGEGPYLRTGDLGFLKNGQLFVTGRLKDLIIIDGSNHYPQDIEQTVERCHPAIRSSCCAAFSIVVNGEERLVVAAEVDRQYCPERRHAPGKPDANSEHRSAIAAEIVEDIRRAIAEDHDLNTYAVVLLKNGSIPKTSSGKIQRHACRSGYLTGALDVWGD